MIFTGLEFDGIKGAMRVPCARLARLRLGIRSVLRHGKISPRALSSLVGHITWAMLSRRETLSMLSATFAFSRSRSPEPTKIWDGVLRELQWVQSTLPLWATSWRL
eukprot:1053501-Pyramimonas_sp.AAC.1